MSSDKTSQSSSGKKGWRVSYTQGDVDTLREQIEQREADKRRYLFLTLIVTASALAGAIILLAISYSLYSYGQSARSKLTADYAALKKRADQCSAELSTIKAKEATDARTRSEAEARLDSLLPAALTGDRRDIGTLAEMVYGLPDHAVQIAKKPPDAIFHNWKVHNNGATSVYTLVGGFVDGKWVIYSNLVGRRQSEAGQ